VGPEPSICVQQPISFHSVLLAHTRARKKIVSFAQIHGQKNRKPSLLAEPLFYRQSDAFSQEKSIIQEVSIQVFQSLFKTWKNIAKAMGQSQFISWMKSFRL